MKSLILFFVMLVVINCTASPMITLDGKKTADFGTFPANEKQSTTFIIKNIGDEDLSISKIRKTCGCSATKLSKKVIPPGQSATLIANIKENFVTASLSMPLFIPAEIVIPDLDIPGNIAQA